MKWLCKIFGHRLSEQKLIARYGPCVCYFHAKCKRCGYEAPYEEKGEIVADFAVYTGRSLPRLYEEARRKVMGDLKVPQ